MPRHDNQRQGPGCLTSQYAELMHSKQKHKTHHAIVKRVLDKHSCSSFWDIGSPLPRFSLVIGYIQIALNDIVVRDDLVSEQEINVGWEKRGGVGTRTVASSKE